MRITKNLKLISKKWLLIFILIIAAFLRFWNLSNIPPHLTPDEAALGYNAYSILRTGRDEYGEILPIIFKSFGDYKPGLYVYLTVPFVALLGLNEFAVRLPSALSGVLSVYLIYLIVQLLFKNRRISLASAYVASVTPWLIYFSRGAWEVNVSLTLTLAGVYFFLKFLKSSKFLVFSFSFFALTLSTYQGAKLSTALVLFILVIIFWKKFISINKKLFLTSLAIGVFISSPIILSVFRGETGRLRVFSIFSNPRTPEYIQAQLDQGGEKVGDLSYYLFHSESLNFARGILGRWFNHFSGRFLFFEGDWSNPRHSTPYQGMLLLSDLILLIAGFIALIRKGFSKEVLFVWLWLILAPLPAVLSRNQVHAVRAFNMVIPLTIISAIGLASIYSFTKRVKNSLLHYSYFIILIATMLGAMIYFLDSYFIHLPKHNSKLWDYGYKQIVNVVTPIQGNYKAIKVQQSFAQPYIYFLFYQKYNPTKYQKQAHLIESVYKYDVGYVERFDNICFCEIDWSASRGESGSLFVADTTKIPRQDSSDEKLFKLIKEIKYLNGIDTAFRILEVK